MATVSETTPVPTDEDHVVEFLRQAAAAWKRGDPLRSLELVTWAASLVAIELARAEEARDGTG
jgi:hypothetical protein